jgi:hypothetical protein
VDIIFGKHGNRLKDCSGLDYGVVFVLEGGHKREPDQGLVLDDEYCEFRRDRLSLVFWGATSPSTVSNRWPTVFANNVNKMQSTRLAMAIELNLERIIVRFEVAEELACGPEARH